MQIPSYAGKNETKGHGESLIVPNPYLFLYFHIFRNESTHPWLQRSILPREPNTLKAIKVFRNPFVQRNLYTECTKYFSFLSSIAKIRDTFI